MRLFSELRRRNVFRVAALYIVTAWLVLQVAGVLVDLLPLPGWFGPAILAALVAGFPVAVLLAWFYKLTSEGISRESDAGAEISIRQVAGRRMDLIIISLLAAALILSAGQVLCDLFCPPDEAVCVLPFDSLRHDSGSIAKGFTEEIHHQLLQSGKVKVLPRNSCLELTDGDSGEKAKELGVGYLVEGSFRQVGQRVRVAVQLVQVADGTHCWSRVYDDDVTEEVGILDLQSTTARSVVHDMQIPCGSPPPPPPPPDPDALWQYQMGMQRLDKSLYIGNAEAAAYFEKASAMDPGFAEAYAGLAFVTTSDPERRRELSLKALELDRRLGFARATLAASYGVEDPRRARTEFDRALELDEDNPLIRELFGDHLLDVGDVERALEQLQSGIKIDPMAIRLYYKTACLFDGLGRQQEARDSRSKAADVDPGVDLSCARDAEVRARARDAASETS